MDSALQKHKIHITMIDGIYALLGAIVSWAYLFFDDWQQWMLDLHSSTFYFILKTLLVGIIGGIGGIGGKRFGNWAINEVIRFFRDKRSKK